MPIFTRRMMVASSSTASLTSNTNTISSIGQAVTPAIAPPIHTTTTAQTVLSTVAAKKIVEDDIIKQQQQEEAKIEDDNNIVPPSTPTPIIRRSKRESTVEKKKSTTTTMTTTTATQVVTPSPKKRSSASTNNKSNTKTKKTRSPSPKNDDNSSINDPKTIMKPPKDWESIYSLVVELRQDRTAPCDHSGCEALPDKNVDAKTFRFQVLISLMLSSQTKDAIVGAAIRNMQKDNILSIKAISKLDAAILQQYINKVGFYNNKTKYIKQTVEILQEKYNGDIPKSANEMIKDLPGVGPKMAYICENVAWNTQSGIGVDTHMHRLFNQLQWVGNTKTKTPEQTRKQLEAWLPHEYWSDVNLLWVGFGQEIQQEKTKLLHKALNCTRPLDALQLLKRCGLDYTKIGKELNLTDQIEKVLSAKNNNNNNEKTM